MRQVFKSKPNQTNIPTFLAIKGIKQLLMDKNGFLKTKEYKEILNTKLS